MNPHVLHDALGQAFSRILADIEDGEGPNRDLDADVAVLLGHRVGWQQTRYTMEAFPAIAWNKPHAYAGMSEPCPEFCASVDAVTGLLGGYFGNRFTWQVNNSRPDRTAVAIVTLPPPGGSGTFSGSGREAPRALCAAAIRAISGTGMLPLA